MIIYFAFFLACLFAFILFRPLFVETIEADLVLESAKNDQRAKQIISDLELDYSTGKVDPKDYQKTKDRLIKDISTQKTTNNVS